LVRYFDKLIELRFLPFFLLFLACPTRAHLEEAQAEAEIGAEAGLRAPEFVLKSTAGKRTRLSDLRGKVVLVDFWATWCPPCRMSIPALVKLNGRFSKKDFEIVGVSLDRDPAAVPPFIKDRRVPYRVLYANESVAEKYLVEAIPTFFLLDREGIVRKKWAGFTPGLPDEWEKEIERLLRP